MNPSPSFRQTLRYIEWGLITLVTFSCAIEGAFRISAEVFLQIIACLAAYTLLSWLFPINRPLWQRLGYIGLGILLALFVRFTGTDQMNLFLYFYIAKSCFLLDYKNLALTVTLSGIIGVLTYIWALPITVKVNAFWHIDPYAPQQIQQAALLYLSNYLITIVFTITFSFMVIAEQKNRQRVEALSQQVESLAAKLERARIARDIHDSLGHTLTNLQVQLAVAQKFRQRDLDKTLQAIDTAKLLVDQCIEDVSYALQTMRQEDFNLNQALSALFEQVRHNNSLNVQWEVNLPQMSLQKSYQIYCIVKEGLMNIQKHARASQVRFLGQLTPKGIMLEIEDNGQGFDPEISHVGFGLKGMSERVQMLGGQLKINSSSGLGTHIQIILPK